MRIVDNTSTLLGDDLKQELSGATKFRVAAACFSIYAFEALRSELGKLSEFEFIFTAPTFVPNGAIDRIKKERREFFIPTDRAGSALSGSEFEIKLRNKMTQRAVARECADWIRRKARFMSNATASPNISLKNFIPSIEIPPCDLHKKVFPYIVTDIPSGFAFGRRL